MRFLKILTDKIFVTELIANFFVDESDEIRFILLKKYDFLLFRKSITMHGDECAFVNGELYVPEYLGDKLVVYNYNYLANLFIMSQSLIPMMSSLGLIEEIDEEDLEDYEYDDDDFEEFAPKTKKKEVVQPTEEEILAKRERDTKILKLEVVKREIDKTLEYGDKEGFHKLVKEMRKIKEELGEKY